MKKKKTQNMNVFIPDDLIVEFLVKLPVKSLLRFKCVCKSWLSLISDPQFAEWQFNNETTNRLLLRPTSFGSIESFDVEALLHDCSSKVYLPLPFPPTISYPKFCYVIFMGSCRGLILLNYEADGYLMLWNPSTRVHKTIPYPDDYYYGCEHLHGFSYNASTHDYIIVFCKLEIPVPKLDEDETDLISGIDVFSFKTNSWNHIVLPNIVHYKSLAIEFRAGSLLNEVFHWMVLRNDTDEPVIIVFDSIETTLSEILLPPHLIDVFTCESYNMGVLRDCLCVCCFNQAEVKDEIWMMKEYKVESSWSKFLVVTCFDLSHKFLSAIWFTKYDERLGSDVTELYSANPQSIMYKESLMSLSNNLTM